MKVLMLLGLLLAATSIKAEVIEIREFANPEVVYTFDLSQLEQGNVEPTATNPYGDTASVGITYPLDSQYDSVNINIGFQVMGYESGRGILASQASGVRVINGSGNAGDYYHERFIQFYNGDNTEFTSKNNGQAGAPIQRAIFTVEEKQKMIEFLKSTLGFSEELQNPPAPRHVDTWTDTYGTHTRSWYHVDDLPDVN